MLQKNHKLILNIVLIAVMSALTFTLTFISIPFGTSKVHLGNFACLLASLIFGPWIGGISGSLGMGLNDILLGYPPQTFIRTIIAKFIMGFLCALPSLILYWVDENKKISAPLAEGLHCVAVFVIVSLGGYLFQWYTNLREYLFIVFLYVVIYGAVWAYTIWMWKSDEKKINRAIDEIRDEE